MLYVMSFSPGFIPSIFAGMVCWSQQRLNETTPQDND
jgi:hypothetical protein